MQDNLLQALLNKLDEVLTGGSDVAAPSTDNYVAWCAPGLPFSAQELQFAIKGINGSTPEETKALIKNAAMFSRVANSIPSSNTIGTFVQNGRNVADVYNEVLRFSRVAKDDITDEERANILRLRGLLSTTEDKMDFIANKTVKVSVDSPLVKAYKEYMTKYNNMVLFYNSKRLAAMNTSDKAAVQDFALNGDMYRMMVRQAMDDWSANGYKNDKENIDSYIQQNSSRSMRLLKRDLLDKFAAGVLKDADSNSDFYWTTLYPADFINSDSGWTEFTFNNSHKDAYMKEKHSSTSGSVGLRWGLWSVDADGGASSGSLNKSMNNAGFEMKFKVTQAFIGRGWFSPEFLTNGLWNFAPGYKPLSDGNVPPQGEMIAYPTTAIFIKDIEIKSNNITETYDELNKSFNAGGSVGWGPFRIGASHSHSSNESKFSLDEDKKTLRVEGMQLIAFKCFALPKCPDCTVAVEEADEVV